MIRERDASGRFVSPRGSNRRLVPMPPDHRPPGFQTPPAGYVPRGEGEPEPRG